MKKHKPTPGYFKKDKYDTKRAVLSYEELPLDDYNKSKDDDDKQKKSLSYKRITLSVMVVILLVAIVFVVFNRFSCNGCSSYNINSDNYPVTMKGSIVNNGNFDTFGDGFSYVSDTHYALYDFNGNEIFNSQVSFNDPVMKLNNNGAAIVYNLGGNKYSLFSKDNHCYSGETEAKLYLADINQNSVYATLTESRDYKAKLSVYKSDNSPLYGYSFEEYYITAIALNPEGTGAVACGVTTENGVEKSVIYVFDFTSETPLAFHEISGDIVFDCEYLSSSSVCAIGDNASYIVNGNKFGSFYKNSYTQKTLASYDINTDTGILSLGLSRSGDGRNCTIQCINSSGKVITQTDTSYAASFISSYKNRVAISDNNKVYLYSQDGRFIAEENVSAGSKQIKLISPDTVIVLGIKNISIYKF